jgi:hypothetical protein
MIYAHNTRKAENSGDRNHSTPERVLSRISADLSPITGTTRSQTSSVALDCDSDEATLRSPEHPQHIRLRAHGTNYGGLGSVPRCGARRGLSSTSKVD